MLDLRKLFAREGKGSKSTTRPEGPGQAPPSGADGPDSDFHPAAERGEGLEVEYQALIATQFRRFGISPGCITIEVRRLGRAPDGFDVLVGMVRLAHWERDSALRVLVGLPLLEAKVRKLVRASWLADFSHFGGLWLHSSEQVHHEGATGELRELLLQLVPPAGAGAAAAGPASTGGYSVSSMPPQGPGQDDHPQTVVS